MLNDNVLFASNFIQGNPCTISSVSRSFQRMELFDLPQGSGNLGHGMQTYNMQLWAIRCYKAFEFVHMSNITFFPGQTSLDIWQKVGGEKLVRQSMCMGSSWYADKQYGCIYTHLASGRGYVLTSLVWYDVIFVLCKTMTIQWFRLNHNSIMLMILMVTL